MIIKSRAELSWQLIIHVPKAYEAFLKQELEQTVSFKGSKPFFYFSDNHSEFNTGGASYTDTTQIYQNTWKYSGKFPPYKEYYKNDIFVFDKPIMVINNKYSVEWNQPPSNFISIEALQEIYETYSEKYQIIYLRPLGYERGFWGDGQTIHEFGDYELLKDYPDVLTIYDFDNLFDSKSYNELQMMIMAMSDVFVSAAGGGSVLCAYFGGTQIIYYNAATKAAQREIWKTGSHLQRINNSVIIGVDNYKSLWEEIGKI